MSLAKLHIVKKSRKEFTCSKCREKIPVGSPTVRFSVGYRGRPQTRHNDPDHPGCYPKPSERESSQVATIYAAQEDADVDSCETLEDLQQVRDDVVAACNEVADEYSNNEMFERNYDLQEREQVIRSAGEELENWEPESEEPTEDEDTWPEGEFESFEEAHDHWLKEAGDSLMDAINSMELP